MEAELKTASIENKWPLLYATDPNPNEFGAHDAACALALEDGRVVTIGHWPNGRDVKLRIFDPGNPGDGWKITTGYKEILPRIDAGVLDLRATGSRFRLAMPIVGEQVDVSWFYVDKDSKPSFHRLKGKVGSEIVKIRVQFDGEGNPHYKYSSQDGNGSNIHIRPTVVLDEPIEKAVCGAAVRNLKGEIVGLVNAIGPKTDGLSNVLIMTPLQDVLNEPQMSCPRLSAPVIPRFEDAPIVISNSGPQLVVINNIARNPDGSMLRETANACVVEGTAITVGHLLRQSIDQQVRVIDPLTLNNTTARRWAVYPEYDAALLQDLPVGHGYNSAPVVIGDEVTVSAVYYDREAQRPAWSTATGRIIGKINMSLCHSDGSPVYRPGADGQQVNEHQRYEVQLQTPIVAMCGSAVTNKDGQLVGIVSAGQDPGGEMVDVVCMTPVVGILGVVSS